MTFNIGEFYKELCSHFNFYINQNILMTALREYLDSFLHIYQA
jgi:hypothetical protein